MSLDCNSLIAEFSADRLAEYVECFNNMPKTTYILPDYSKALLAYSASLKLATLTPVSRPCFLYMWFCWCKERGTGLLMKNYSYFSEGKVLLEKYSYRDFTQMFVRKAYQEDIKPMCEYIYQGSTTVYFGVPMSLRSIFDRLHLEDDDDEIVMVEGNLRTVKCRPLLMQNPDAAMCKEKSYEPNCITATYKNTVVKVKHGSAHILSTSRTHHQHRVDYIRNLVRFTSSVVEHTHCHTFTYPNREINYSQIVNYVNTNGIDHTKIAGDLQLNITNIIEGITCSIIDKITDCNKCYYFGDREVYRAAGERVLVMTVSANIDKENIEAKLYDMFSRLDKTIEEAVVSPLTLPCDNIAKLRATNSLVFDSYYCRKASPSIQPIIISKEEVESERLKGKMILVFDGRYYTTKDKEESEGRDCIGMINKFGDYDPGKLYVPLIRTYKKCHLISSKFKEVKAYLLRHSSNPTSGKIAIEDIILPAKYEYLYRVNISNPEPYTAAVHSKKTQMSSTFKTATSEVPDHVKSIMSTDAIRLVVINGTGNCLTEACCVDKDKFSLFCKSVYTSYPDMSCVSESKVNKDLELNTMDHRLYGKILEDYLQANIIVFDTDGIVPYRYSTFGKRNFQLLFLNKSGYYRAITLFDRLYDTTKLRSLIKECNRLPFNIEGKFTTQLHRNVDYEFKAIRIISYIAKWCRSKGVQVTYNLVDRECCKGMVEQVYKNTHYYECRVKSGDSMFIEELVTAMKKVVMVDINLYMICMSTKGIVSSWCSEGVVVDSPVDLSDSQVFSHNLEDILYDSVKCYWLQENEEIRCIET